MKSTDKNLIELFDDKKIYFDIITSNIFLGILFAVILWNSLSLLTSVFIIFSIIVVFKIYSNFAYKSWVKDGIIVEFIYISCVILISILFSLFIIMFPSVFCKKFIAFMKLLNNGLFMSISFVADEGSK